MRWSLSQTFNTILVSSIVTSVAGTLISINDDSVDLERREPARQRARPAPLKLPARQAPVAARLAQSPKARSPVARRPAARAPAARRPVVRATVARRTAARSPAARSPTVRRPAARSPAVRSPAVRSPVGRSPARPSPPRAVRGRAQTVQRRPSSVVQRAQRSPVRSPTTRSRSPVQRRGRSPATRSPTVLSPVQRTQRQIQRTTSPVRSLTLQRGRPGAVHSPTIARAQIQRGHSQVRSSIAGRPTSPRTPSQIRPYRATSPVRRPTRQIRPVPTAPRRPGVSPIRARAPLAAAAARRRTTSAAPIRARTHATAFSARRRTNIPATRRAITSIPRRGRTPVAASSVRRRVVSPSRSRATTSLRASSPRRITRTTPRVSPQARMTRSRAGVNTRTGQRPTIVRASAQHRTRAVANTRTGVTSRTQSTAGTKSLFSAGTKSLLPRLPARILAGQSTRSTLLSQTRSGSLAAANPRRVLAAQWIRAPTSQNAETVSLCARSGNAGGCPPTGSSSVPAVAGSSTSAGTTSPWAYPAGQTAPKPFTGRITAGQFKSTTASQKKYKANAAARGVMWDDTSNAIVPIPATGKPAGSSVDHTGEVNTFVKALNKAGYTDWSQLPHDAQLLLAQRIHHADNVMIVPKVVEEPKGPAFQQALNGQPAQVPPETKRLIDGVEPHVQANFAATEVEWTNLRAIHPHINHVEFVKTHTDAYNLITK